MNNELKQNFSWCKACCRFYCDEVNLHPLWMLVHCQQILFSHTYINKHGSKCKSKCNDQFDETLNSFTPLK